MAKRPPALPPPASSPAAKPSKGGKSTPPAGSTKPAPAKKPTARRKASGAAKGRKGPRRLGRPTSALAWLATVIVGGALGLALAATVLWLEAREAVRTRLAEAPPTEPLRVLSAPMTLREGVPLGLSDLAEDLVAAGYERSTRSDAQDRFVVDGGVVRVWTGGKAGTLRIEDGRLVEIGGSAGTLLPTVLAVLGDREAQRTPVTLATISPHLPPALLAIEDARFHDHPGVDPIGLLRALWVDLRGGSVQGGSTVTQQLAKNLFVGPERSIRRKVREAFFAAALESELTKDQLLELYLSEVYLGHVDGTPVRGVEQAARTWFGKSAASLTVAEAATIAGVIASPNVWSPVVDAAAALRRRNTVLDRMVAVRALTEAQGEDAQSDELVTITRPAGTSWRLPWVVEASLAWREQVPDAPAAGEGGALHTTVQPQVQRLAERALSEGLQAVAAEHPEAAAAEGAVVVLEARTGNVVALVGGRSFASSPFPRATRAERQGGSTIKPLTLLLALDADPALTGASLIDDSPISRTLDGRTWSPRNSDGTFLGPIPLREAIARSRNTPAVLLAEKVGRTALRDRLVAAGLTDATDLPSAALGAFPVTPLALAGAWTAFPAGGQAHPPRLLASVVRSSGAAVPVPTAKPIRLASAEATAEAVDILRAVLQEGTARKAAALGVQGAFGGKTGTTDDGRDAWFVGFDPRHVVVVWVGLDRGALGLSGAEAALPIWARVVRELGLGRGTFPAPSRKPPTPEAPPSEAAVASPSP